MSDDDVVGFSFLAESEMPVGYLKPGGNDLQGRRNGERAVHHQKRQVEIQLGNRLLATLVSNDIFGEMALIDSAPGSATANRQD